MKLELEIKQKTFRSEYHKLAVNIFYTYGWLMNNQSKIFKEFGISHQQFNILRILQGAYPEPSTIHYIKDRMLDKMSDVSRLIDKMKANKLVTRKHCDDDRRKVDILITEKGKTLLDAISPRLEKIESELEILNPEEAKELNHLLDRIRG
ncbi:MAG: MarR family transcriptional regulator [Ignavibacteriales bacterium]|nr:MarR family transcriptional regulator [Ignavibacteriales bacterium]